MFRSSGRRFLLVAVTVLLLVVAIPAVALADNGGGGRFKVFGSVTVEPGETVFGDAGSIFGSVVVRGRVMGSAFSIFSSVRVSDQAQVNGDTFSIFSDVQLSDQAKTLGDAFSVFSSLAVLGSASVQGDAWTVFSSIDTDPTATIAGSRFSAIDEMEIEGPRDVHIDWGDWDRRWSWRWGPTPMSWTERIGPRVIDALALALVGVLIVVLFPRNVENVKATLVHNPGSSFGVGLLGLLLVPPLALLLLLTCIGFFAVIIGAFLVTLLGLTGIGLWIGERVLDRTGAQTPSLVPDVFLGTLIMALTASLFFIVPYFWWLYYLVWFGLLCLAFGAALLRRLGRVAPVAKT